MAALYEDDVGKLKKVMNNVAILGALVNPSHIQKIFSCFRMVNFVWFISKNEDKTIMALRYCHGFPGTFMRRTAEVEQEQNHWNW